LRRSLGLLGTRLLGLKFIRRKLSIKRKLLKSRPKLKKPSTNRMSLWIAKMKRRRIII
jgi:hypothetical protein